MAGHTTKTDKEKAKGREIKKKAIAKASGRRLDVLNAKIDRSQLSLKVQRSRAEARARQEGFKGVTVAQAMIQLAIGQIAKQERDKKDREKRTTKTAGTAGRAKRAVASETRSAFRRTFRKT